MPMVEKNGVYIADMSSRYFAEDFPYGLAVIKGIAELFELEMPYINKVFLWYQTKIKESFHETNTVQPDILEYHTPQRYGITSKNRFIHLYTL